MRRTWGCLFLLAFLVGCDEATAPDPKLTDGAGIRFIFPAAADSLTNVLVQVWGRAHNGIPAPDCDGITSSVSLLSMLSEPPDSCTLFSLEIRNWIHEVVRSETNLPFAGTMTWGWDTKDDAGLDVPGGIYKISAWCEDSRGPFTFDGEYYVPGGPGPDPCQWLLWSHWLPEAKTSSFGPFDPRGETLALYEQLIREVGFLNPFVVRVYATGVRFEQEITLTEGKYTDVHVELAPYPVTSSINSRTRTP